MSAKNISRDSGKKILVVEDEPAIQRALLDKLEEDKFVVLQAKNGQEGLDMAKANHPDLILLDIIMPVMDGITMLKTLRDDEWGKDVPVMLLTNLSEEEKIAEAFGLGSFGYLIKTNWSLADVTKKIKEKLNSK